MSMENPMPDFVDALELRLREAAAMPVPREPRRRQRRVLTWPRSLVAAGATCAAVLAVILVVSVSDDRSTPAAYGKPLILETAPVQATDVLERVQRGGSVLFVLGEDAKLTSARPVKALGGTGFVLIGDKGWCLTAPDPAISDPGTADPTRTGAVTCARRADVYRYGIALGIGNSALAAVPDGAKSPTLTSPDGDVQVLQPSAQGIVTVADAPRHSRLTLYASDGTTRDLTIP